jgi:hypothetical protein
MASLIMISLVVHVLVARPMRVVLALNRRRRRRFRRWHNTPRRQCLQTVEPQIVYRPVSPGQLPNDMGPFQRSFPEA